MKLICEKNPRRVKKLRGWNCAALEMRYYMAGEVGVPIESKEMAQFLRAAARASRVWLRSRVSLDECRARKEDSKDERKGQGEDKSPRFLFADWGKLVLCRPLDVFAALLQTSCTCSRAELVSWQDCGKRDSSNGCWGWTLVPRNSEVANASCLSIAPVSPRGLPTCITYLHRYQDTTRFSENIAKQQYCLNSYC